MSYQQIEALGEDNFVYPNSDYYAAEYLLHNEGSPYFEIQTIGGVTGVVGLGLPEPPANAIDLPPASGGDDTSAVQNVINANPGGSFVGSGTYRLSNLTVSVPARIWDCLLYTSPSPRDLSTSRMPSSA